MASPWLVLLAVLVYGLVHSFLASLWAKRGARRWFGIFGLTFQPAEAAKAVLVLYLASYFGRRGDEADGERRCGGFCLF